MTVPASRSSPVVPLPTVLVTRPIGQAAGWVCRLGERGVPAQALPLMGIGPAPDAAAVEAAWATLATRALVVFVSPNAVDQFAARRPAGFAWPAAARAGSPGPGTSAALRAAGVPAAAIVEPPADGGQFDSEGLWAVLRSLVDWRGASVLIVRGSDGADGRTPAAAGGSGREWLTQTLRAAGAQVDAVAAYARCAPLWNAAEEAAARTALAMPRQHLWLFSSAEAIGHLLPLAARVSGAPPDWRASQALATHPRIAARALAAGFGRVLSSPPTLEAVAAAVLSLQGRLGETPSIESCAP